MSNRVHAKSTKAAHELRIGDRINWIGNRDTYVECNWTCHNDDGTVQTGWLSNGGQQSSLLFRRDDHVAIDSFLL